MFWKKKEGKGEEKELSPKEIVANKVEQLGPGEALSYRLAEVYGGGLAIVEPNPQYPEKGKKYFLSLDKIVDEKPTGKRSRLWESNKPKDFAGWIIERGGQLYS